MAGNAKRLLAGDSNRNRRGNRDRPGNGNGGGGGGGGGTVGVLGHLRRLSGRVVASFRGRRRTPAPVAPTPAAQRVRVHAGARTALPARNHDVDGPGQAREDEDLRRAIAATQPGSVRAGGADNHDPPPPYDGGR